PQPHGHGNAALVHGAASGNQQREIGHIKKDRRQQLEEAPLPRIDLRQRHGEQGDDEHQQRQRQSPLQLRSQANYTAAEQSARRQRLPLAQLYADFGLGQQHAVGVVLDGAIVGLAGVAVVAIAVRQNQVAAAIGLHFLSTALSDQHRQATFFSSRARQIGFGNEHPSQLRAVLRQLTGIGHPSAIAQALEAPRNQGVELGQRILLV